MSKTKLDLSPEVRSFFAEIGRKNGKKLYKERGSEYFKKIAAMRKTHGRQKAKPEDETVTETKPTEIIIDKTEPTENVS